MKVGFYQRGSTIYCRLYHKNSMVRFSTGIKFPDHVKFLSSRECFAGTTPDVNEFNIRLSQKRVLLAQLYAEFNDIERVKDEFTKPSDLFEQDIKESYMLCDLLDKYFEGMINGSIKSKRGVGFAKNSIRAYQFAIETYKMFALPNSDFDLTSCDFSGKDIKERVELSQFLSRHFDKFTDWMLLRAYSINTRSDIINIVTFIMKYWSEALCISIPKIKKPAHYQPPIVTLPDTFVSDFLSDKHKKYDKFSDIDKYIWEVCSIMLITSLRVGDAVSLKPVNFQFINGGAHLVKENEKTGKDTVLPLPTLISEIVGSNITKYGRVYSIENNSTDFLRGRLNEFMARYEEMHKIYFYSRKNYMGKNIEVSGKLCDLVHPHMLRKTAITLMLANGVSPDHVRFASNHSPNSPAFNRYVGFVEKRHKSEIADYYKRILNETSKAS